MSKKLAKLLALLIVLAMAVSMFAGCSKPADDSSTVDTSSSESDSTADTEEKASTLVYATATFGQKFSPFFATTAYDQEVVDLVSGGLLVSDREGNIVENGIEGETRAYNGTDYFYNGIGSVEVVQNDDGTVDYNLTMRDDIKFSDGEPANIDDVIFGIYAEMDSTYDGAATLYALPIEGLEEYRASTATLTSLLIAAGKDNTDFSKWTEEEQNTFWSAVASGAAFAQEIVDYVKSEGYNDESDSVAACAANWGYELADDATVEDFFIAIGNNYAWDFDAMDAESAGSSLSDLIDADTRAAVSGYNIKGVETGEGADYISGIIRTGDYSLTVHCTEFDATTIYNMSFVVTPLHYYGDESLYDYDNHSFGFPKGDLSSLRAKTTQPLGCGPYTFESYANGVVTLKANPYYFNGQPKIETILMQESEDADYIPGIQTGTFDLAVPSISADAVTALEEGNSNGELSGDMFTTILVDYRGYGYLGMNADLVNVGGEPASDASKDLRVGIMTVLSVYRDTVINSYYGDRASVIQYPISNTSWAAPRPTDEGYKTAYSTDVDGNAIYTDGMTDEEKYDAALQAAIGYFKAAGYTWDEAAGKFTAAPEGAKMSYEIMIPGNGKQDHPAYGVGVAASEALATIGIDLKVNDVGAAVWNNALEANTAELWVAAWQATADPDMYQVYHSSNAHGKGTNSNHYAIDDASLDELIVEARSSADQAFRKAAYKECLEKILSWGCELPLYQRKDCTVVSTARVNVDTMPKDMTPFWGWYAEIENLEMN